MEPMHQTPDRNATNPPHENKDATHNVDKNTAGSEPPQMKVMGRADGSRTTAGEQAANTTLSSRPDQSLGPMGNAAGFPPSYQPGTDESRNPRNGSMWGSAMMNDVAEVIRQYPLPAMMVGIGIGYLLSRGSSRSQWVA